MAGGRSRAHRIGLRWRLAAWVALVTFLCTGVAFFVVYRGTGANLRRQIDQELAADSRELWVDLVAAKALTPAKLAARAARYVHDRPFGTNATLLFVQAPGAGTTTNRPELFSPPPPDASETTLEQVRESRLSARLLAAASGYTTLALADSGALRLLKVHERLPGIGAPVVIGVADPLASVTNAQQGVARAFVFAGLIALLGALVAAYLIGTRVSRPLRRMAAVAARVDAGDLDPRIHEPGAHDDEVRVLADAFNHMLDRLTAAFAGQRAFVADASHELRTPLTVIRGQMEVLAAHPSPSGEEVRRVERLVAAEVARIGRLVDDLLLLAKTEQTEFLRLESIDLQGYVEELWDGMTLLAERRFELLPVPAGTLRADPDRLAQALRNLVRNAIDHTAPGDGLLRLQVEALADRRVRFVLDDDGPGIPLEQRERVFHRFHRTGSGRSRSGGTGLGLAIVRAIAEAHGGSVRAHASPEGGARIELELPWFTRAGAGSPAAASDGLSAPARERAGSTMR